MSPAPRTYRPPRRRREVALAVAGSLGVVAVTAVLLWVLAPKDETSTPTTPITLPSSLTTTTVPGAPPTTVPSATTPTSAPG